MIHLILCFQTELILKVKHYNKENTEALCKLCNIKKSIYIVSRSLKSTSDFRKLEHINNHDLNNIIFY